MLVIVLRLITLLPYKSKANRVINLNTITNNLNYSFLKDKIQCKHTGFYLHQNFQGFTKREDFFLSWGSRGPSSPLLGALKKYGIALITKKCHFLHDEIMQIYRQIFFKLRFNHQLAKKKRKEEISTNLWKIITTTDYFKVL